MERVGAQIFSTSLDNFGWNQVVWKMNFRNFKAKLHAIRQLCRIWRLITTGSVDVAEDEDRIGILLNLYRDQMIISNQN